jgi:hypothetical protein
MLCDAVEESGAEIDTVAMWTPEHKAAAEPRWPHRVRRCHSSD